MESGENILYATSQLPEVMSAAVCSTISNYKGEGNKYTVALKIEQIFHSNGGILAFNIELERFGCPASAALHVLGKASMYNRMYLEKHIIFVLIALLHQKCYGTQNVW